jgi:NAD(P)-dependent dehydrogenase (short-subunit alcohol dehydrogenase family)
MGPVSAWAHNSAVECVLHTDEVGGPNPSAPTEIIQDFSRRDGKERRIVTGRDDSRPFRDLRECPARQSRQGGGGDRPHGPCVHHVPRVPLRIGVRRRVHRVLDVDARLRERRHAKGTDMKGKDEVMTVAIKKNTQVWLITGSSRGLGRALAEAVLAAGHRLVATARNPEQLAELVERHGNRVRAVALDVTDERASIAAVQTAVDAFGRLDVLANNAGYGDLASIEDTSMKDFRAQIETNLFGVVHVTKAAIPVMRRQGSGHILQFSSVGGRVGPVGRGAYAAAKWGVEGFSEVLAKEVGPLGVKVTIIEPGGFRTDFAGSSTTIAQDNPVYAATVGAVARFQREYNGAQPGDPSKAAAAIIRVAGLDEPPLRLLLGSDAVRAVGDAERARIEADRMWQALSVSTDFEAKAEQPRVVE